MTPPVESHSGRLRRWLVPLGAAIVAAAALILLFARAVDRDLNHDEHQFLAPAALLSREGLLPWRDYPLFHLPNLVFLYAAADLVSGNLLLGAKLLCFVATAGVVISLIRTNTSRLTFSGLGWAFIIVLLFLSDPLVRYTAGKTWNHEIPTAFLLAAFGLFVSAAKNDSLAATAGAGVLAGLAAGCRLTFAPALIGFAGLTWFFPGQPRRRFVHLALLTVTATVALAPSLWFLATERTSFLFGNFEFPRLRLADADNTRVQKTATWWRKIRYFFKEIVVPGWAIFALWAAVAIRPGYRWFRSRSEADRGAAFLLVLFPFVLAGCFAPTRYQYQHYYVFIPLLLLAVSFGLQTTDEQPRWFRVVPWLAGLAAAVLGWRAVSAYTPVLRVAERQNWYDAKLRDSASDLRRFAPKGRVLTLAPTIPLAAGASIYPEFATGPFSWRSAALVPPSRRPELRVVGPADLESFLSTSPPAAILTGVEDEALESPLVAWAEAHMYTRMTVKRKQVIWVPPASPAR